MHCYSVTELARDQLSRTIVDQNGQPIISLSTMSSQIKDMHCPNGPSFSTPHAHAQHDCSPLPPIPVCLRTRIRSRSHPVTMALGGMELWNLLLHDLDGFGVLESVR